jgi:hypothetical protein
MVQACPMGCFGPLGGVGHHHGLYIPHGDTYFHGNILPACLRGRRLAIEGSTRHCVMQIIALWRM